MDVTNEIRKNHLIYGASDYTASHRHASGRSLNYADGPSITRPANQLVTIAPYTLKYESAVGLFGAENYFVKVQLDIQNNATGTCYEEEYWLCGFVDYGYDVQDPFYGTGFVDRDNFTYTDGYDQASVTETYLPYLPGRDAFVSVDLKNLKVGNIYIDDWLDVRLYTKDREESIHLKKCMSGQMIISTLVSTLETLVACRSMLNVPLARNTWNITLYKKSS